MIPEGIRMILDGVRMLEFVMDLNLCPGLNRECKRRVSVSLAYRRVFTSLQSFCPFQLPSTITLQWHLSANCYRYRRNPDNRDTGKLSREDIVYRHIQGSFPERIQESTFVHQYLPAKSTHHKSHGTHISA